MILLIFFINKILLISIVSCQNWWNFENYANRREKPIFTPLPEIRYTHSSRYEQFPERPNDVVINVPKAGYGTYIGFSEMVYYDYTWSTWPPIKGRKVNVFLGIPYAAPPVKELRFRRPYKSYINPEYNWYARKYRPDCIQPEYRSDMNEDCLYLNIFTPNRTWESPNILYPVSVFIHGGTFVKGSSRNYPAHALASNGIVVVTFNYRLGPFGFLATGDFESMGNYGLWDQVMALEWVKENIRWFRGDPDQITVIGHEAGAASIGIMLVSPVVLAGPVNPLDPTSQMYKYGLFHKTILMSGSALSHWAVADPTEEGGGVKTRRFVEKLAELVGCPDARSSNMHLALQCLRFEKSAQIIQEAASKIEVPNGAPAQVWSPVVDGTAGFLPRHPRFELIQKRGSILPTMETVVHSECAAQVNQVVQKKLGFNITRNLSSTDVRTIVEEFVRSTNAYRFNDTAQELLIRYTWWSNLANETARAEELINMYSDYFIKSPMYEALFSRLPRIEPIGDAYFGVWAYRGLNDTTPKQFDIYQGIEIPFLFGFPFFNESTNKVFYGEDNPIERDSPNIFIFSNHVINNYTWNYPYDTNMSEFAMILWSNFIKFGNPTPLPIQNITWLPFQEKNQRYAHLYINSSLHENYRHLQMTFWRKRFNDLAQPLPAMEDVRIYPFYEAQMATIGLAIAIGIIIIAIIIILYYLCKKPQPDQFKTKVRLRDGDRFSSAFRDRFAGYQPPPNKDYTITTTTGTTHESHV